MTKPEHPRALRILCHGWYDSDDRIGYPRGKIIYWEHTTARLRRAFTGGETYIDRRENQKIPVCEAVYFSSPDANPVQEFKKKEADERRQRQKWGSQGKQKEYPGGGKQVPKSDQRVNPPQARSPILKRPLRPGERPPRPPGKPVNLPVLPPDGSPPIAPITILEAKYSQGLVRAVDLEQVAQKVEQRKNNNESEPESGSGQG